MKFGYDFIVCLWIPITRLLSARGLFRNVFRPTRMFGERSVGSREARAGGERRVGRVPCNAPRLSTAVGRRGSHICSCLEVEDVEWWGRGVMWCVKCNGSGGHPAREPVHPQDVAGLGGLLSSPHRRAGSSVDPSIAAWFACTLDASSVSDKVELTCSLKCPIRSKQIIIYFSKA